MQNQFTLTDNPQEIQINGRRIQFRKELGIKPDDFIKQANELFNKHRIEFPSNFSTGVDQNRYYPRSGIRHPTKPTHFNKKEAKTFHEYKLSPFLINCIRLENEFNIDSGRFLKELIKKPPKGGLLHNGSLLVVLLSYAKQSRYQLELPPPKRKGPNPDFLIQGIYADVKYLEESDFLERILQKDEQMLSFTNNSLRLKQHLSVKNDTCYNIGKFISERCPKGIPQADMLFADFSDKSLRDLKEAKHPKPKYLPAPRTCRIVFFSWSMYTNLIESAYFIDFNKQLWHEIKTCSKRYHIGAGFLTISSKDA